MKTITEIIAERKGLEGRVLVAHESVLLSDVSDAVARRQRTVSRPTAGSLPGN
jgi:hypothetical protein